MSLRYIFVSYSVPSQEVIVKMWLDGSNKFSIPKKVEGVDKGKNFILTDLAIDIKYKVCQMPIVMLSI